MTTNGASAATRADTCPKGVVIVTWKEAAERRWAERLAPSVSDPQMITVSSQAAIPRPASEVWAFVHDPASSVLTIDNVVQGFTMPGTPVGEVGEVQVLVMRLPPSGRLVGILHEVVELDPGTRAVTQTLSWDEDQFATTEVLPVDNVSCVLRVTIESPVPREARRAQEQATRAVIDDYLRRVKDVLTGA